MGDYSKAGLKKAAYKIFTNYFYSKSVALKNNSTHRKLSLSLVLFQKLGNGTKDTLTKYKFIKDGMSSVSIDDYKEWDYFHYSSMIINVSTLFDVYLSDINRMLYQVFPGKLSSNTTVTIDEIFKHSDLHSLQNAIINNKVYTQSYDSFAERIKTIKKNHSLKLVIKTSDYTLLESYSKLRNEIVHKKDNVEVKVSKGGHVKIDQNQVKIDNISEKYINGDNLLDFIAASLYESILNTFIPNLINKNDIDLIAALKDYHKP